MQVGHMLPLFNISGEVIYSSIYITFYYAHSKWDSATSSMYTFFTIGNLLAFL